MKSKDSYYVQQGSTQDLRVANEDKWYVVRETWIGDRITNVRIMSSHDTEAEAKAERKRLMANA